MAIKYRSTRKASDEDIIMLNSLGLSLQTIGKELKCHPTTISARLHSLGIAPADTRRSFMEDVILSLEPEQQRWLANQLGPRSSIKTVLRNLLVDSFELDNLRVTPGKFNDQRTSQSQPYQH